MMKITCGTDIIEIDRIRKTINEANGKFLDRVYNTNEIEYCEGRKEMKYQHYAGRFAAKEAIFKSISNRLENKFELSWKDVEVVNDEKRKTDD